MRFRDRVRIREVGPREALQANPEILPTEVKVQLIRALAASGIQAINAVSLVSPKAMPHMADAEAVLEALGPLPGVRVSALAPNVRALDRALALHSAGLLDEVHLLHAATQSVLRVNGIQATLEERLSDILELADTAKSSGLGTSVFVSAAFGCSMEGAVPADVPVGIAARLKESRVVDEVVISDSTGQADPRQVSTLLATLAATVGDFPVTLHFHDSRGTALANALAALDSPLERLTLDAGFGGLGGDVPFLPEAAGNLATEDLVEMLHGMAVETGIETVKLLEAEGEFARTTGWTFQSRTPAVGPVRWKHSLPA
jgi:hydroxymethylglutaryl-CoA lyase